MNSKLKLQSYISNMDFINDTPISDFDKQRFEMFAKGFSVLDTWIRKLIFISSNLSLNIDPSWSHRNNKIDLYETMTQFFYFNKWYKEFINWLNRKYPCETGNNQHAATFVYQADHKRILFFTFVPLVCKYFNFFGL